MSLRELVDPECGGANALMRLGNHMIRDAAHKDDGLSNQTSAGTTSTIVDRSQFNAQSFNETQLVDEFLGQMSAPPPQTFRMDDLLQEMREIDAQNYPVQVMQAPPVLTEINNGLSWTNEFSSKLVANTAPLAQMTEFNEEFWPQQSNEKSQSAPIQRAPGPRTKPLTTGDYFDEPVSASKESEQTQNTNEVIMNMDDPERFKYSEFMRFMNKVSDGDVKIENSQPIGNIWADEFSTTDETEGSTASGLQSTQDADWVHDFAEHKANADLHNEQFNKQFWDRLQDEWKKISERAEEQPPWLSEFSEYYDPYKEYVFDEENPMLNIENVFEKGKAFLEQGDIPSAVLCFESAVRQDMNNAEIWELLGTSQAENEKDPNAIAALKKSLELKPNNRNVLMALAISYTNESLQNQALRMLIDWLRTNEKYQHIVPEHFHQDASAVLASSLISGPELKDVQDLYIQAAQISPNEIDADIQEALGVLFNLSAEYEKAADCYRAAAQVKPNSAKVWNRLGASLANGNQSVAAVDAYQHALAIEPGYIRARYNVGIICINLKAYNEAAEHFLTALNHQATSIARSGLESVKDSSNQMSDTIWSTLRMAISLMGRNDLHEAIDARDLSTLNDAFKTNE